MSAMRSQYGWEPRPFGSGATLQDVYHDEEGLQPHDNCSSDAPYLPRLHAQQAPLWGDGDYDGWMRGGGNMMDGWIHEGRNDNMMDGWIHESRGDLMIDGQREKMRIGWMAGYTEVSMDKWMKCRTD